MDKQQQKIEKPVAPVFVYVDIDEKKILKIAEKMKPAIVQLAQS